MYVKLLLLMNCAIVANCQSTDSSRNDVTYECELFENMKSEMESIRQLLMGLQKAAFRSESQSEIEEIRQIVTQQLYWTRNGLL